MFAFNSYRCRKLVENRFSPDCGECVWSGKLFGKSRLPISSCKTRTHTRAKNFTKCIQLRDLHRTWILSSKRDMRAGDNYEATSSLDNEAKKKRNDENYSKGAVILDVFNIEWKKLKKKNCVHTPLIHTREVSFGTVRYTTQATMQAKKGNKMLKENYSVTDSRFLFVECFNRSWSSLSNVPVVFLTCSCSVQWNFQGAPSVLWFSFFFFSSFFFYSIFEKTKRFCFFFPQIVFRGERKSSFLAIFFPSKEKNLFRVWTQRDNENIFTIVYQSIFFELKKHFCLQLCGKINCETKFNESFWCGLPIFLQFHSSYEWSWKKFSQHISQKTSSEKIDWKILESERKHAIKFN